MIFNITTPITTPIMISRSIAPKPRLKEEGKYGDRIVTKEAWQLQSSRYPKNEWLEKPRHYGDSVVLLKNLGCLIHG